MQKSPRASTGQVYTERLVTSDILIEVAPRLVPESTDADKPVFVFAYRIRITNQSSGSVQLLNRYWLITDGMGRKEEVRGPGVIGQQPKLAPGESFEYESFCPLPTSTGTMRGQYEFVGQNGAHFEVEIPEFFLADPRSFH